ncbi:leucine-rich repeat domain-containing protein, partial [Streptomyces decoyicus]
MARPDTATPLALNLWKAGLSSVPSEVWRRDDWEVLILADNALTEIPAAPLGRLRALHTLDP